MKVWGITDVGLRRKENQDAYAVENAGGVLLAVVCDGMGGVTGGRVASGIASDVFMSSLREGIRSDMSTEEKHRLATRCIDRANAAVYQQAKDEPLYHGMGTTLVAAMVNDQSALVCNVGDSRAYRISGENIQRVTRDHSVVERLIETGDITPEQARTHPKRNLITRALGPDRYTEADSFEVRFSPGDCLLLCSDGLTGVVEDQEIGAVIAAEEDGERALNRLLDLTLERGAPDNVTAILIRSE